LLLAGWSMLFVARGQIDSASEIPARLHGLGGTLFSGSESKINDRGFVFLNRGVARPSRGPSRDPGNPGPHDRSSLARWLDDGRRASLTRQKSPLEKWLVARRAGKHNRPLFNGNGYRENDGCQRGNAD
jgi:hypothetical protein